MSIATLLVLVSDHDYFQEKLSEIWLKNVNITEIIDAEITKFEKKLVAKALIPYGRLRGAREFTPQILAESANVQKEQMRINLLVA